MNPTYTDRMRLWASITLTTLATAVLVGCSAAETEANPFEARFEEARTQATTDFERDILEDGEITRAEYDEAVNRFIECMEAQSIKISAVEQSGYYVFSTTSASSAYEAADPQCRPGTIDVIEALYVDMTMNPENRPYNEVMRECLIARGLVDEDFTTKDLNDEMSRGGELTTTEEFTTCLENPSLRPDEE